MGSRYAHLVSSDLMRGIGIGIAVTTLTALFVGWQQRGASGALRSAGALVSVNNMHDESLASAVEQTQCSWQTPRINTPIGNPLYDIFRAHQTGPLVRKWPPYFDVYHRYFQKYRGKPLSFLEIGVQSGGSIKMWQKYFGDGLAFHGMDINPYCKELFEDPPKVTIIIADQGSREFWGTFRDDMQQQNHQFDIILDDGGHTMSQQITTFEEAWPLLKDGGVYICEDMSTSMVLDHVNAVDYNVGLQQGQKLISAKRYGGGYAKKDTWITYTKQFVDIVNGHYVNRTAHNNFDPLQRTDSLLSAAFYDQMVVLEKGPHPATLAVQGGNFKISIRARLKDGKVDPDLLRKYRAKLRKSQEWRGPAAVGGSFHEQRPQPHERTQVRGLR